VELQVRYLEAMLTSLRVRDVPPAAGPSIGVRDVPPAAGPSMRLLLVLSLVVAGCSNGSANNDAGSDAGTMLTPDEQAAFDVAAPSVPAVVQLVAVADSFFKFDPTLDTTQSDVANAQLIENHIATNLGTSTDGGTKCATLSLSGATLTADFGPAPGCTLSTGLTLSGTIAVAVTKPAKLSVAFTFTNVTVNGTALAGTLSFTTADAMSFTVIADVMWATDTLSTTGFTVSGSAGAVTLSGPITNAADATTTTTFSSVVWMDGACYPSSGTLVIVKDPLTETVTFTAGTATTGDVTITVGMATFPATLPTYGSCS